MPESLLRIIGGKRLLGSVSIAGAKNAALPEMAAGLLSEKELVLENVPQLSDIDAMAAALVESGAQVERTSKGLSIQALHARSELGSAREARSIRTGILFLGPMLARFGRAVACLPGGCPIGARPIDLHCWGLERLGATVNRCQERIEAHGTLHSAEIALPFPSVGATENIVMAATGASGATRITGAACEPEVADLCRCLNAMGADVEGGGSSCIVVYGRKTPLHAARHRVLADRIEAGSYALAAAATAGDVILENARAQDLKTFFMLLEGCGVEVAEEARGVRVSRRADLQSASIVTAPYPGFPTDLQAQFTALMCVAPKGEKSARIDEKIFENRFMHVQELKRMGATIALQGCSAIVTPGGRLRGARVVASDLRASFSLVIAALAAEGESEIAALSHLDRGYEGIERKLSKCGADITRLKRRQNLPSSCAA